MIYVTYFPRYHVWTKGHAPTNFAKWRTATTPYKVCDPVLKYQKKVFLSMIFLMKPARDACNVSG